MSRYADDSAHNASHYLIRPILEQKNGLQEGFEGLFTAKHHYSNGSVWSDRNTRNRPVPLFSCGER